MLKKDIVKNVISFYFESTLNGHRHIYIVWNQDRNSFDYQNTEVCLNIWILIGMNWLISQYFILDSALKTHLSG